MTIHSPIKNDHVNENICRSKAISAYQNSRDYLNDYLHLLSLQLHLNVLRMRKLRGDNRQEAFLGLFISDSDVDLILSELHGEEIDQQSLSSSSVTVRTIAQEITELSASIEAKLQATRGLLAWQKLQKTFLLSDFEIDLLLLALAPELDSRFAKVFAFLHDDINRKMLSIELAQNLLADKGECAVALHASSPLLRFNIIEITQNKNALHNYTEIKLRPRLINYLTDIELEDESVVACYKALRFEHITLSEPSFLEEIRHSYLYWKGHKEANMLLCQDDCQAEVWALHFAIVAKLPIDMIDWASLLDLPRNTAQECLRSAAFEAHSRGRLLFIKGINQQSNSLLQQLGAVLSAMFIIHCPLTDKAEIERMREHMSPQRSHLHTLSAFSPLMFAEFCQQQFDSIIKLDIEDCLSLVSDNTMSLMDYIQMGSDIKYKWFKDMSRNIHLDKQAFIRLFKMKSRELLSQQMQGLSQKVALKFGLDDIVLKPAARRGLENIIQYQAHHNKVMQNWGFEAVFSQVQNHASLFLGPSGTGKTMAASVIANELGLDLFRIELATVVSKYIGETEKNLDKIFERAKQAKAILFIDEADSLFGKRTAVKDAHDRYANLEVSYLLQKLEEHPCLVILASNLGKNIDDAFLRRFSHIVEFSLPQTSERILLWEKMKKSSAPICESVNLQFLAEKFELSGGCIRNCILQAAYMAAHEDTPIQMSHLVNAVAKELVKQRKPVNKADFGDYYSMSKKSNASAQLENRVRAHSVSGG